MTRVKFIFPTRIYDSILSQFRDSDPLVFKIEIDQIIRSDKDARELLTVDRLRELVALCRKEDVHWGFTDLRDRRYVPSLSVNDPSIEIEQLV